RLDISGLIALFEWLRPFQKIGEFCQSDSMVPSQPTPVLQGRTPVPAVIPADKTIGAYTE
ncbi:MAG: hypothetical protein ACYTDW_21430, partial [Planctomycetota bacterium]